MIGDMREQVIAQERRIMAEHKPDKDGNCVRCVWRMPVVYPNTGRTFPCGPYLFAAGVVARLTKGTVSR